jgi:hypothetical protein
MSNHPRHILHDNVYGPGNNTGSIYFYDTDTGSSIGTASGTTTGAQLGFSLTFSELNQLIAGAPGSGKLMLI